MCYIFFTSNFYKNHKSSSSLYSFQVRKLRFREVKCLTHRHRANQHQSQISYSDMSGSISVCFLLYNITSLGLCRRKRSTQKWSMAPNNKLCLLQNNSGLKSWIDFYKWMNEWINIEQKLCSSDNNNDTHY